MACSEKWKWFKSPRFWLTLVLAFVVVAVFHYWANYPAVIEGKFPGSQLRSASENALTPGTYGDMFGSLNALFSGLAFALLIYTALLQSIELELQRRELKDTRDVFQKQTAIQDAQLRLLQEESRIREQDRELAVKPLLMLRRKAQSHQNLYMHLYNAGPKVFDLSASPDDPEIASVVLNHDTVLDKENPLSMVVTLKSALKDDRDYCFRLRFRRLDDLFEVRKIIFTKELFHPKLVPNPTFPSPLA